MHAMHWSEEQRVTKLHDRSRPAVGRRRPVPSRRGSGGGRLVPGERHGLGAGGSARRIRRPTNRRRRRSRASRRSTRASRPTDDRRDRIRAQRRKAFGDTKFDVQLRTYDLDRDKYDDSRELRLGRRRFGRPQDRLFPRPLRDRPDRLHLAADRRPGRQGWHLAARARPGGLRGHRRGLRAGAPHRRPVHQRRPQGFRYALPQPQRLPHDAEHVRGDRPAGYRG